MSEIERKQYMKEYYLRNKNKLLERNSIYRENNKDRISSNNKYYYKRNLTK